MFNFMEGIWRFENKLPYIKEEVTNRAGEMSQQLRELASLTEVPGSLPSTHMVAHNHPITPIAGDLIPFLNSRHAHGTLTYMQATHSYRSNKC